ncbi:hypothetical protein PZBJ_16605 [Pantoea endophytica]|uniref:Uncharacterized protein n=1 Tax=Pantoea endophytica TaxID=92488 RepID=A0ABX4SN91_9GAMM|nr:glucosyltransferase domain-containing protein [Pantoea endophytica]PLR22075.1 hypothetical protein PZBJ_16605 [Pantoea endophytica]
MKKNKSIAFCILSASMPLLAYQFQFQNQADTLSISILLATLMAVVFDYKYPSPIKYITFVLLGIFCMSIYQSIILFPIALVLIKQLVDSLNNKIDYKAGSSKLLLLLCLVLIIYIFYSLATHYVQLYLNIPAAEYFKAMLTWGKQPSNEVFQDVLKHLKWRLGNKSHFGLKIYWITAIPLIIIVIKSIRCKNYYSTFLAICIYLFPFSLDVLTGTWLPARTLTQIPICFAALISLSFFNLRANYIYFVSFSLLLIGASNSNRLFYADFISNQQDNFLSQMMLSHLIMDYPEFNAKSDKIYFYGNSPLNNKWRPSNSENFGMSFFQYGDSRIVNYMNMTGFMDLKRVNDTTIKMMENDIKAVPCWPDKKSIIKRESDYIIKYCTTSF